MRVRNAWEYRKATVDTSSCWVIFGEADFLPGIVIDKFSDVLVVESLALGIDRLKPVIVDMLRKVLSEDGITIRGVYERSDAKGTAPGRHGAVQRDLSANHLTPRWRLRKTASATW